MKLILGFAASCVLAAILGVLYVFTDLRPDVAMLVVMACSAAGSLLPSQRVPGRACITLLCMAAVFTVATGFTAGLAASVMVWFAGIPALAVDYSLYSYKREEEKRRRERIELRAQEPDDHVRRLAIQEGVAA